MVKIDLATLIQPALIIPAQTGVFYHNQVGGTACFQRQTEGCLIPIEYDYLPDHFSKSLMSKIEEIFSVGNSGIIGQSEAKMLQKILADSICTKDISIDWDKLEASTEAWVHVLVSGTVGGALDNPWQGQAVLTWPNSD